MHVLLVNRATIPVFAYGGTERVIWDLGKALDQLGHQVTYLVPAGSTCPFGRVLNLQPDTDWSRQVPDDVDVVHFQFQPERPETIPRPWLMTQHGNSEVNRPLPLNTVFLSGNHAQRHGSSVFVHNGLDWSSYGPVNLEQPQDYHHFLGKAAWRVKNVQGAIDVARQAGRTLKVLGGDRLNFRRGFRFTLSPSIHFYGMVGGEQKMGLLRDSSGLIFPVRWHEPFGLAVIESLFFGAPVFATPYGALPELVDAENGVLSNNIRLLAEGVQQFQSNRRRNHERAQDMFNAMRMARDYLKRYTDVINGHMLHTTEPAMSESATKLAWTN